MQSLKFARRRTAMLRRGGKRKPGSITAQGGRGEVRGGEGQLTTLKKNVARYVLVLGATAVPGERNPRAKTIQVCVRGGGPRGGGCTHLLLALVIYTIDHASLSSRITVPTPNRHLQYFGRSVHFFHILSMQPRGEGEVYSFHAWP